MLKRKKKNTKPFFNPPFHWICEKCGQVISKDFSECSMCKNAKKSDIKKKQNSYHYPYQKCTGNH